MQINKNNPKVSIIMSTYNNEKTISDSILSIVNQKYKNWEFLIIDDASKDRTAEKIEKIIKKNKQIKLFKNKVNKGLAYNLNILAKYSSNKYLARMDADDIAMPMRLSKQIDYIIKNPDIDVLGTAAEIVHQGKIKKIFPRQNHNEILKNIIIKTPFIHPTVLMKKSFLEKNKFYKEKIGEVEDLDLWLRSCNTSKFHNLNEVLLIYNFNGQKMSRILRSFNLHIMFSIKQLNLIYFFQSFLVLFLVLSDKFKIRKLSSLK